ncbi:integral membrane sensor signal transduction histidine kinase [Geobacter metallireducens RCH3]|uniref:histidine kinase n=1 Tax=Geobacter metallireducens (strain ATCC 53774 / DSM 7210 / GS-15) TaxID=269799 RepID=Q39QV4_GEOMG|nr:ATP-binding protein [Geobacter metallireducens]ABB33370.1 sensor histidine kinase, HAMP domain-containing [Geobacter metallireducens GS-15]EHP85435.1 integral membrane sensor signal transduction histidine kinase [Geobacter metallireducens RCH3]
MTLNTRLVMIMLTLLVIAILTLFFLNQYSQNEMVQEIQESSTMVTKALQMSIEDLTSEYEPDRGRLTEYLKEAKVKGVKEINIFSNEGEIIDSSNPAKIGKKREIKKLEKGLKVSPGTKTDAGSSRAYDLVVPVIVGDEQLGYVQINLLLDNIRTIQHENFVNRVVATSLVFLLGISLTIFLAKRYTAPINHLADGVRRVAVGDLSVTFPVTTGDEIGELAKNFNEMVEKLREREILEKRLYEAEHLSRVGQLASGIAHEIRNPLNYISLAIDHLKSEFTAACPDKTERVVPVADKIKEEVRRANYMVVNFMNFGRPLKLRITEISYRELIEKALPLLEEKLAEQRVTVRTAIPTDLPAMRVDGEMLRNCLFNFVTNAAQAMPDGGTVTLGATFDREQNRFLLTFSDEGCGIREEDLAKVFQPWYTTREAGIGLGLAITERIVREHGGEIRVASSAGKGTTFTVLLPGGEKPGPGTRDRGPGKD